MDYFVKSKLDINAPSFLPRCFSESIEEENLYSQKFYSQFMRGCVITANEDENVSCKSFIKLGFFIDEDLFSRIVSSTQFKKDLSIYLRNHNSVKSILSNKTCQDSTHQISLKSAIIKDEECCLCLLPVQGKKFGLLVNCSDVFCLECIKKWRKEFAKSILCKQCPQCRLESGTLIPSDKFITDKKLKLNMAQENKKKLAKIPCKYSEKCPYLGSCLYNHSKP